MGDKGMEIGVRLQRTLALMEIAKDKAEMAHIRWRSQDLGCWQSVDPRWKHTGSKIYFRFQGERENFTVLSAMPKPWGLRILLSGAQNPVPAPFDVCWQSFAVPPRMDSAALWSLIQSWLRGKFAGHQIVHRSRRADLARTLSSLFLRIHFRHRGKDWLLVAADDSGSAPLILGQALRWLSCLNSAKRLNTPPGIHLLVPVGASAIVWHRCRYLDGRKVRTEVWEYRDAAGEAPDIRKAPAPPQAEENKDFRWPVLGPFRWSPLLEKVLNLAPSLIRRYPRFQDYDSLRLWGLEFAQVMGPQRDRIFFGVGDQREELTDGNFEELSSLVRSIIYFRRADSPDMRHPYYRLQAERWLEAMILEDMPRLFPEIASESVYSQIPVYLGANPGRVDILSADRQGTLIVLELKVDADPDLPLQALDYWGRVIGHNENGDFERRGYFSEMRLNRNRPRIYLVSPVFSFHDSTESMLGYLDPALEVWKVSINEDWRCGVRVVRRIRYQGGKAG
jgi:hypothetical protein